MITAGFGVDDRWLALTGSRAELAGLCDWLRFAVSGDHLRCDPAREAPDLPLAVLCADAPPEGDDGEAWATLGQSVRADLADWLQECLEYDDAGEIASDGWHAHFELVSGRGAVATSYGPAAEILLAGR